MVGNIEGSRHLKSGSGLGEILYNTINLPLAEPDRSGLKQSTTDNTSTFHGITIHGKANISIIDIVLSGFDDAAFKAMRPPEGGLK